MALIATDAGEQLLRSCQQILELTNDVVEETKGPMRLTCGASFGSAQMASAIADFLTLHPKLKIDMHVSVI